MPRSYLIFFIFFNVFFLNKIDAQSQVPDTAIYLSAKNHIIQLYIDSAKENLRLYNGTEFTAAYRSSLGHPFYEYSDPQTGEILYDGILYPGVKLLYDIIRDEVIFINEFKNLNIKLIPQKISWFTLQDHKIVQLFRDSNTINFPGNGFYEQLYEGLVSVFKKSKKQLYEPTRQDESAKFVQYDLYYVRKNNTYYQIDNKRSLLTVCSDRKSDVSKFIQRENLNFKKDPAAMLTRVIDYYLNTKN
jgi:hypothetical protein